PRLPLEAFEHTGYYDELHRATQGIEWRTPELLRNLLTVVRDVPTLVAFGLMIATVSPILLVFEVIAAGASIAVSVFAGPDVWSVIRQPSFERRLADYHFRLLTSREHAKELRLYRLGSYLIERWSQLYWKAQNEQRRAATRAGIRMSLTFVFSV